MGASLRHNFGKLFVFSGRDTRGLFWPYALMIFLLGMVANVVIIVPVMADMFSRVITYLQRHPEGLPQPVPGQVQTLPPELMPDFSAILVPMAILGVATLFLYAAGVVRRLHDCDRTGWWAALPLPPQLLGLALTPMTLENMAQPQSASPLSALIGLNSLAYWGALIALIVFLASEGTSGPNRFGEAPAPR